MCKIWEQGSVAFTIVCWYSKEKRTIEPMSTVM